MNRLILLFNKKLTVMNQILFQFQIIIKTNFYKYISNSKALAVKTNIKFFKYKVNFQLFK